MKKFLMTASVLFALALAGTSVSAAPDLQTRSGPHYMIDETFSNIMTYNNMPILSSWDVDNSAGQVISSAPDEYFYLKDESTQTKSRMSRTLDVHDSGVITFETRIKFANSSKGAYLRISDEGGAKDLVRLNVRQSTLFYQTPNGEEKLGGFKLNVYYPLKMVLDLDAKQTTVMFNGKTIGSYPFTSDAEKLAFIEVSTAVENTGHIYLDGMKLYTGFEMNEQFLAAKPGEPSDDWTTESGSGCEVVVERTNAANWPDYYCMKLSDNSSVSSALAEKSFRALSGHASFEFKFATEKDGNDFNVSWKNGDKDVFAFSFANNAIVFNGTKIKDYVKNVWYSTIVEADFDTHEADIYINEILVAEKVKFSGDKADGFRAETAVRSRGEVWLDDIRAFAVNEPADEDYVPAPQVAESDDFLVGMQTCDMWREGFHLGYDYLNSDPERIPLMGFYDEGSRAAADWETKIMLEHGVDFRMSCWFLPKNYTGGPIKMGSNAFDLMEGYKRGKYSDMMDYAILWEGAGATQVTADMFKDYIVPFWVEQYFKDPRYLVVDNKPVVFIYLADYFYKYVGGGDEAVARECIQYLRDACKEIGFDDAYIICSRSASSETYVETIGADGMYNYAYSRSEIRDGAQQANLEATKERWNNSFLVPAVSQGYNDDTWLRGQDGKFLTVEEFKSALEYVRDDFYDGYDKYVPSKKMVMLNTWNEYAEGHIMGPVNLAGFGYLDAAREVFTANTAHEDEIPSDAQKADYGILYPKDREAIKIGENMKIEIPDTVVYSVSGSDFEAWEKDKQIVNGRVEDGLLKGDATGIDPSVISPEGLEIDLTNISYVHVRMNQISTSKSTTLYFITEDDQKWNEAKGYTFTPDVGDGMSDVYFPMWNNINWKGKMIQFRIDPLNALGSFEIESIEFLQSQPGSLINIILDGKTVNRSSLGGGSVKVQALPIMHEEKICLPMPCWSAYFGIKAIYIPDEAKIRLLHDVYYVDIDVNTGATTLNGEPCEAVPFVLEGNQYFVGARAALERMGYTVGWDSEQQAMTVVTPAPVVLPSKNNDPEGTWNFNTDEDMQGWTAARVSSAMVSEGVLYIETDQTSPSLTLSKQSFDAAKYTTLRIGLKNKTTSNRLSLYFGTDSEPTLNEAKKVMVTTETGSDKFVEYEMDLTANALWKGKITTMRIDPGVKAGEYEIDYIILSDE